MWTEGPWSFGETHDDGSGRVFVTSDADSSLGTCVAEIDTYDPVSGDPLKEWRANARLIAAAPEMAELLEKIGGVLETARLWVPDQAAKEGITSLINKREALLTKLKAHP